MVTYVYFFYIGIWGRTAFLTEQRIRYNILTQWKISFKNDLKKAPKLKTVF
jgi:hypothetical protein